jgi:antitoxin (DNA-binding transcriptional repressor) of toxin-antitoxin stability system
MNDDVPDLARFLDDPATRRAMDSAAAKAGRELVVASDDEPVAQLMARLGARADEPVLIAIPRLRWGFVLLGLERLAPAAAGEDGAEPFRSADSTSVGMLYDAIKLAGNGDEE